MNDAFQFGCALPVESLHGNRLVVVELLLWVSYIINFGTFPCIQ